MVGLILAAAALGVPAFVQVRTASGDPFRRAGFDFGKEYRVLTADELDEERFLALVRERRLVVEGSDDGEVYRTLVAPTSEPPLPAILQDEAQQTEAREQQLQRQVETLERDLADRSATVDQLERSVQSLQGQIEHCHTVIGELRAGIAERDAAIAEVTTQLQAAKAAALQTSDEGTGTGENDAAGTTTGEAAGDSAKPRGSKRS